MSLVLERIFCRYPGHAAPVLRGIDMSLASGSTTLISGSTGSGKSTLSLILCGAIPNLIDRLESGGRVVVDGEELTLLPMRQVARKVGLLMQNVEHQLFTDRVEDEVAFGLENMGVPAREIESRLATALQAVGANHLRGRALGSLSSGERQRVMLAALVSLGQSLLVLDEPLAYLDRHGTAALFNALGDLSRAGKTIVVFEHRRDLVRTAVDRELWLGDGRLLDTAPAVPSLPRFEGCASPAESRLICENVSFLRGDLPILRELCLEVRAHESVVLLGDNGAGKTTLLRLVLGLEKTRSGQISVCGLDPGRIPTRQLALNTALVLQNPDHQLFLDTVRAEVTSARTGTDAARAELEALGLCGLAERHPQSLSTGEKRRVTIAAALARHPKLLLLDEPTVGQDDASLALVVRRLHAYVNQGGALLVTTHDERAARALGSRIVLLREGRVIDRSVDDHFVLTRAR